MTKALLVLLVEDEPLLLLNAQDALESGGFEVVDATDAESAMTILERDAASILGLITDVRLGSGATGWDVARHARELKPSLRVVYTTAESPEEWAAHGVPKSILVPKPFAAAQLLTAISTLLNDATPGI